MPSKDSKKNQEQPRNEWKKWIITISFAFIIGISINYLLKPTTVSGLSMYPTLEDGDRLFLNTVKNKYNRGDIIVFEAPQNESDMFIKRIIGVEGDHIVIRHNKVFLNGSEIEESYISPETLPFSVDVIVPDNEVFVLGDNRDNSQDSRMFGTVSSDKIVGSLMIRFFPMLKPVEKVKESTYVDEVVENVAVSQGL